MLQRKLLGRSVWQDDIDLDAVMFLIGVPYLRQIVECWAFANFFEGQCLTLLEEISTGACELSRSRFPIRSQDRNINEGAVAAAG